MKVLSQMSLVYHLKYELSKHFTNIMPGIESLLTYSETWLLNKEILQLSISIDSLLQIIITIRKETYLLPCEADAMVYF